MSAPHPWIKFYPRDWRGDQALRAVSLAARGLWIDMLSVMHEGTPYGHLTIGDQPCADAALARLVGSTVEEVQALLVELRAAGVFRQTRSGVIYSKRLVDDRKRSVQGKKDKEEALEKSKGNPRPSSPPKRGPTTQRPEARAKIEGPKSPSILSEGRSISNLKVEQPDDERSWAIAISEAERDELRCRRSDPDLNSELCEFIATAKAKVADLRRARLSIVAAA